MASEAASTNATAARYYRALFVAAAVWNLLAAFGVLFVLENSKVRTALGFPGAPDIIALQLLASCLLLFGLGYYWVSRDLSRNHDLVWLGVIGKPQAPIRDAGHAARTSLEGCTRDSRQSLLSSVSRVRVGTSRRCVAA